MRTCVPNATGLQPQEQRGVQLELCFEPVRANVLENSKLRDMLSVEQLPVELCVAELRHAVRICDGLLHTTRLHSRSRQRHLQTCMRVSTR